MRTASLITTALAIFATCCTNALPFESRQRASTSLTANFDQCDDAAGPELYGSGITYGFNASAPSDDSEWEVTT